MKTENYIKELFVQKKSCLSVIPQDKQQVLNLDEVKKDHSSLTNSSNSTNLSATEETEILNFLFQKCDQDLMIDNDE